MILEVYLDNSATTKPCKAAIDEMISALNMNYGNPSSQHELGIKALTALNDARANIAKALYCEADEIYFAPSGTIANNAAIFGAISLNKKKRHNILTSSIEHPSVMQTIKALESKGASVKYLDVDNKGRLSENEILNEIDTDTSFISIMAVNNEIGTINPISFIKKAKKRSGSSAIVHCDAVQAFGKIPINPKDLGIDILTISSHKIHGVKGAAALYIRKGLNIPPFYFGGGQEKGVFSGTEDIAAIMAFSAAARELQNINQNLADVKELRDYTVSKLENIESIHINSPNIRINSPEDALPYILNISVLDVPSEVLVNFLSSQGVYISAGSACKRGHKSEVLKSMKLEQKVIDSAVRISFSRYTKKEEIDYFVIKIKEAIEKFIY